MKSYISAKQVKAYKAYRVTYPDGKVVFHVPGTNIPVGSKIEEGYRVIYPDGYKSWCPKEQFKKSYMQLFSDEDEISEEMLANFFRGMTVSRSDEGRTVYVKVVLRNGDVMTESYTFSTIDQYDEETGVGHCMERIYDKLRGHLEFMLHCAVHGVDLGGGDDE